MNIEYIYHSGFSIETDNYFLVFDYYKGDINFKNKTTIVFSTHGHADHFNPAIFKWSDNNQNISYVLSSDIEVKSSANTYIMKPYETLKLFDTNIKSFGSTDLGLSYLIKVDNVSVFFAGDLNWWYWDDDSEEEKQSMAKDFKAEIQRIKGNNIDIAFFPVDPRLKENYYLGGEYFIKELSPKVFIPMHFGENHKITADFAQNFNSFTTKIIEIDERNQIFELK